MTPKKKKKCETCDECVYIGDGDYVCTKEIPARVVLVNHSTPEEDYLWCKNDDPAAKKG